MAGVNASGFVPKTLDELKTELEDAMRAIFNQAIDTSPQTNFAQLIGVFAERFSQLWDAGEEVYSSFSPDSAVGASLDAVCAITGTVREPAVASTALLTMTGTDGTVLSAGRVASNTAGTRFATDAAATIALVAVWADASSYTVGDRVSNSGNVYQCVVDGTSAGSGGPTGTGDAIADNTTAWRYLGAGDGAIDVDATAEQTGPKLAPSGTITTIATPVSGWSGVINTEDAVPGSDRELDGALRLRREEELRANGRATLEAIRAQILLVDAVTSCTVFENPTDTTDGDGVPPHAFEALVRGGDSAAIAESIFKNKAAGIATYGGVTETVTDSQSIAHSIKFSRPSELTVYVEVTAEVDAALYPTDGDDQIKAAIVAFGDLQKVGKDVVASSISAQCFKIAGVLDASCNISFSPGPVASTTLPVTSRQLALYDTSRITVASTPGTP